MERRAGSSCEGGPEEGESRAQLGSFSSEDGATHLFPLQWQQRRRERKRKTDWCQTEVAGRTKERMVIAAVVSLWEQMPF